MARRSTRPPEVHRNKETIWTQKKVVDPEPMNPRFFCLKTYCSTQGDPIFSKTYKPQTPNPKPQTLNPSP